MNCLQYGMVFVANILLARIMKLKTNERICFLLLTVFSYPYILFGLIVEQYMVAYFYLMLALYTLSERKERNSLIFCGVSGTLITGLVLAPLFSDASPWRNFKKWLSDMRQLLASFFVFFVASCKSLYIFLFFHQVQQFSSYAAGASFQGKWLQYVNFLSSCLVAPTDVEFTRSRFYLTSITRLNLFGLFVLIAVCVSFAFNYKDATCRYAFGWIVFSFFILCVMGWGSVENTMPLYSLYFSWACIVLLYRLFQKIAEELRCAWILYVCCAALGLFLLYRNSQGVRLLTSFFAQFTPADILKPGV